MPNVGTELKAMLFMSKMIKSKMAAKPKLIALAMALFAVIGFGPAALADQPVAWGLGFQEAATPVMTAITGFHDILLYVIIAIAAFVLALMIYVSVRFNAKRNPVPSRTTHNTLIEVLWTAIPVIILLAITIPSLRLLYFSDRVQDADMTIKVVGHQWYWSYEYPDDGGFAFDSLIVAEEDLEEGQPRLLAVDEQVVVPVDTNIRILLTADDVLHSWAVPALGVKTDTVPGRINESWMRVEREGVYYGQCSELCGVNHGFMPIAVRAVSKEAYAAWVAEAKEQYASALRPKRAVKVARADIRQ